eukprot:COSAG03_NODE_4440_length_1554_cov_1.946392_2_plen_61_part_01
MSGRTVQEVSLRVCKEDPPGPLSVLIFSGARCAGTARRSVPHKDFSELYEKMSGKGASASE